SRRRNRAPATMSSPTTPLATITLRALAPPLLCRGGRCCRCTGCRKLRRLAFGRLGRLLGLSDASLQHLQQVGRRSRRGVFLRRLDDLLTGHLHLYQLRQLLFVGVAILG